MKQFFTLLLIVAAGSSAFSQNIVITEPGGAAVNEQSITVNSTSGVVEALHELWVINNSSNTMQINCKRREISVTPYTKNYFCWFLCLNEVDAGSAPVLTHPSSTSQCPSMSAGDTVKSFSAHHKPQTNTGISTYRYIFYDVSNPNDSTWVDIVFDISLGLKDVSQLTEMKLFPNPASGKTQFSYNFPSIENRSLVVFDVLGQKIAEYSLNGNSGKISIDITDLREGVYFCSLLENGKAIETKRLLISR